MRIVDNLRMHDPKPHISLRWDIFCRVIDNFGDIGVCWRLAAGLAQLGQQVRLWTDDASALSWMAPKSALGVTVMQWRESMDFRSICPGDVLVEAFGCEIAHEFIASYASYISTRGQQCFWINLEYLSAESYAEHCHTLPSPVMTGPGAGLVKHFFYPGFTPATGGLLRERDLLQRQSQFDRANWLTDLGIDWQDKRLISLFCYEPCALDALFDHLANDTIPSCLLITAGRARAFCNALIANKNRLQSLWNKHEALSFFYLPPLTQTDFDHLLWACDLNFVRGEDSLVRALWAGKPLVWQIYPQDDGAHAGKLHAFLNLLQAKTSLRDFHHVWNGLRSNAQLPSLDMQIWQKTIQQARQKLLQQDDLASTLIRFVSKNH